MRFFATALAALLAAALLAPVAQGQITVSIDTTLQDKNCGDFEGILEAQATYEALQVLVQDSTADPFGLDADGNGIACEGLGIVRRVRPGDTTGFSYTTVEEVEEAVCPSVPEPFDVQDVLDDVRALPRDAMADSTDYAQLRGQVECLRNLGLLGEGLPIPEPPPPEDDTTDQDPIAPSVGSIAIDTADHPSDDAHFDVSFSAFDEDGDLDSLHFELWNLSRGERVDQDSYDALAWGDGTEASNDPGSPFRFVAAGEDGSGDTYQIRFTVYDGTGLSDADSAQVVEEFEEENVAPVIDSVSIDTAASTSADARFHVRWGASDANANLDSLAFELWNLTTGEVRDARTVAAEAWGDGTIASNDPGTPFEFVSEGEDGSGDTYQIRLTATDSAGAAALDSAQVVEELQVGGVAPSVDSIDIDTAPSPNNAAHFDVTWGVSDQDGDLDSLSFELWNITQGERKKRVSFDPLNWGDGSSASNNVGEPFRFTAEGEDGSGDTYEIRLTVFDAEGLSDDDSAQVVEEFVEQNVAPAIDSVTIDTAAHPSDHAHFDVTWGASDENGNLDSLSFELRNLTTGEVRDEGMFAAEAWGDGSAASNDPGEPFRFVSGDEDGSGDTYQIRITAIDSAGAMASDSAQVVEEVEEENVAPVIDSVSIDTAASTSADARFHVRWGASDANANLDSLAFELWNLTTGEVRDARTVAAEAWGDGTIASNDPGDPFVFVSAGEDGSGDTYEIRLTATDSAGAQANASAQVVEETESEFGTEPSFVYAEDCWTYVHNATVHAPEALVLPSGEQVAEGDTVAAVSPRGNCVGHFDADSDGKWTVAVAAKNDTTYLPNNPGMWPGEDFSFEIYDVSAGFAYSVWPVFTPCEEVDMGMCEDLGGFVSEAFYEVDSLQVEKPSYEDTTATGSLTVSVTTTYPYSEGDPALQTCGPGNPDHVVQFDAGRARKYSHGETDWVRRDTSTATGTGYAVALGNMDEQPFPQKRDAAFFDVPVDFCATGDHYLWVRVAHGGGGGASNSFHVRSPTDTWHSYNDIYDGGDMADAPAGQWTWVNQGGSEIPPTEQGPMVIEVPSTGVQKLLFRMREVGIRIDSIILTTNPEYQP